MTQSVRAANTSETDDQEQPGCLFLSLSDEWLGMLAEYRRQHSHPVCQATHLVSIPLIVLGIPLLLVPSWGLPMLVGGAVLQIIGHRVQGNRPLLLGDRRFGRVGLIWWVDTVLRFTLRLIRPRA